ncbi:hypothetical protein HPNQ4099_1445 [Helicobacter pylori NQ4099]|uniref:Uncharacterized protein n=1 Tax=Helicobacter pylori NQ4099 TaxID=992026 RepID=I9Q0X2_HELPX|nr:hypothetical protein [Helicobacter pylori]EJB28221.1 hypothetical protein HPNQ4099_1445 [Helicobacter pylori NQ4099]
MVSYSFINLGGGFGISAYYHAHKLACLAGYLGYGIITDFSALSATMWWWSLSKITWFCIGYIALWGLTLIMGFLTCSVIEDYS